MTTCKLGRRVLVCATVLTVSVGLAVSGTLEANAHPDMAQSTAMALPLSHAGHWITDANGKVVVLHGENVVNKLEPYYPAALGFGDDDAELLAAQGYNAARLGFFWSAYEPSPGVFNDAYLRNIRGSIETLHRHGIMTLVESHSDVFGPTFGGDGAPGWAAITGGKDNPAGQSSIYAKMMTNQALQAAFDNFFANAEGPGGVGIADRYAQMWTRAAKSLAGTSGLIGYGVINQPSPGADSLACLANQCPQETLNRLDRFNALVTRAIRAADHSTPITLSGYWPSSYGASPGIAGPPDSNTAYGFNAYCIAGAVLNASLEQCGSQFQSTLAQSSGYTENVGVPGIVNEFGSTDDVSLVSGVADLIDDHQMSWFHWSYHAKDTTNTSGNVAGQSLVDDPAAPLKDSNLNDGLLDALARPYPKLTSGRPHEWKFDAANRVFNYSWSTERARGGGAWPAGAITEIAVPQRAYPHGYIAEVTGGRVVSQPNATVLRVAGGAADRVAVRVADASSSGADGPN